MAVDDDEIMGKKFGCPLCEDKLEIRLDKHRKPYCVCDPCGVQLFIRKDLGKKRLIKRLSLWGLMGL